MKQFFKFIGIDRAIAYTLFGRGWGMLSGLITLWFISKFLSPAEQGFYYTFASILALQIVFELGMSYVVMQFASHEMARMSWASGRILTGNAKAKSRLRSLLVLVVKWYGGVSLLIVLGILPAGWVFFTLNHHDSIVVWHSAWIWLIFTAALNIFITPIFAIFEGCGRVTKVAQMRMAQNIVGSTAVWLALAEGGGLLAMPIMNTGMVIVALFWLWHEYRVFFKDLFSAHLPESHICWRTEIWPFQWRVGLSWLSGYFIFQLFVPVLFSYHGSVEAGQMGMSLNIVGALASVAVAWVNTKAPVFGKLVSLKQYSELDSLFFKVLRQSTFVIVLGGGFILIGKYLLGYLGNDLNNRILPMLPFALLICTTVINHIVFAEAAYLRSHKEEPFMWLSILTGLLVAISTVFTGKQYGTEVMMFGYLVISIFVGLGWGTWIFHIKRLKWHGLKNEIST